MFNKVAQNCRSGPPLELPVENPAVRRSDVLEIELRFVNRECVVGIAWFRLQASYVMKRRQLDGAVHFVMRLWVRRQV